MSRCDCNRCEARREVRDAERRAQELLRRPRLVARLRSAVAELLLVIDDNVAGWTPRNDRGRAALRELREALRAAQENCE